jgi:hypothetical protein
MEFLAKSAETDGLFPFPAFDFSCFFRLSDFFHFRKMGLSHAGYLSMIALTA